MTAGSNREQKPWGVVEHVLGTSPARCSHDSILVDQLFLEPGGFSSLHLHGSLANAFVLLSGAVDVVKFLRVKVSGAAPPAAETPEQLEQRLAVEAADPAAWEEVSRIELRAHGDNCLMLPHTPHRFEVLEPSELVEIYWRMIGRGLPESGADIRRFIGNGRK